MSKRIAIVHPYLNVRGGAERKLLAICQALLTKGANVTLFVKEYEPTKTFHELIPASLKIVPLGSFWHLKTLYHLWRDSFDLIIASNFPANLPVSLTKGTTAWICNEVAPLLRPAKKWWAPLDRLSAKSFDQIIANSQFTASQIESYYHVKPKIIYSGIALPKPAASTASHILILTRMEAHKNLALIPKICNRFPNQKILLAGTGEDAHMGKEFAAQFSNLEYLGEVSPEQKTALYNSCLLFAFLPEKEPLGVTVMEAIAANKPVVAFAAGGPLETILHGINGLLCKTETDYLAAIEKIIAKPWQIAPENGLGYIEKKFSFQSMQNNFAETFFTLLERGRH